MKNYRALIVAAALAMAIPAWVTPAMAEPPPRADIPLADAGQEARAKALFTEIRCVVCQHESIVDSPASIAADLRGLVRDHIKAGLSDDEIQQDLVRRYGDYVLFRPPFKGATVILWLGPFLLVGGVGAVFAWWSRRRRDAIVPLTESEESELAEILAQKPVDTATLHDKNDT